MENLVALSILGDPIHQHRLGCSRARVIGGTPRLLLQVEGHGLRGYFTLDFDHSPCLSINRVRNGSGGPDNAPRVPLRHVDRENPVIGHGPIP